MRSMPVGTLVRHRVIRDCSVRGTVIDIGRPFFGNEVVIVRWDLPLGETIEQSMLLVDVEAVSPLEHLATAATARPGEEGICE